MCLYYTGYANEMGHGTMVFVVGLSTDSDARPGDHTWSTVVGDIDFLVMCLFMIHVAIF